MTKTTPSSARRRLGRGLTSLINMPVRIERPAASDESDPPVATNVAPAALGDPVEAGDTLLHRVETARIRANPYQPRKHFDEAALASLAASIREAGMMQPLVVRPHNAGGEYELIAGERRWRAAQRIGLLHVPAIVREVDVETAAQLALIENLQREDLNALERAEAFRRLADDFELTHQEIADRVGLDRTSITNHLRLLELDEEARSAIAAGELSMGHGRALLAVTNLIRRRALLHRARREGWSVRELERRATAESSAAFGAAKGPPQGMPAHLEDLQRKLSDHLGLKVRIHPGRKKGAGRLIIDFYSLDEFEGLLHRLSFDPS